MCHRRIVIFDELSRQRNGFRRNVLEASGANTNPVRGKDAKSSQLRTLRLLQVLICEDLSS